jgi:hypothetical protein
MELVPCASCRRHVAVGERACPFCGSACTRAAATRPRLGGRFSRAAVFAGATLAGCQPRPPDVQGPPPDDTQRVAATPPVDAALPAPVPADAPPPPAPPPADAAPVAPPVATATATIRGVVRTTRGVPIPGVRVHAQGPDRATSDARTDQAGTFTLRDLAAGVYRVTFEWEHGVSNPRHVPPREQRLIKVVAGGTEDVVVRFEEPAPVPIDPGPCCKPYGAPPARRRVV